MTASELSSVWGTHEVINQRRLIDSSSRTQALTSYLVYNGPCLPYVVGRLAWGESKGFYLRLSVYLFYLYVYAVSTAYIFVFT